MGRKSTKYSRKSDQLELPLKKRNLALGDFIIVSVS